MNSVVTIRPALQSDAAFVAEMIQLSMGHLADYLFGADHRSVQAYLENLVRRNAGRFAARLSHVAESAGTLRGALVSFKAAGIDRINLATFPHLFPALGVWRAIGFMQRGASLPGGAEAKADEYYISNVGVHPSAQGQGVGSALLKFAEKITRDAGLSKTSLIVGSYNQSALRLYQSTGYQIVETVEDANQILGYYRMVKVIDRS